MAPKLHLRAGCVPCQRRKKRCDGSLYPHCKNCQTSGLLCTWPEQLETRRGSNSKKGTMKVKSPGNHIKLEADQLPSPGSTSSGKYPGVIALSNPIYAPRNIPPNDTTYIPTARLAESETKRKNYFLERIAMQQDCVDDRYEETMTETKKAAGPTSEIKNRIAQQLDVGEE